MNVLNTKFKEVLFAVSPIVVIVTLLHLFLIPLEGIIIGRFYVGAILIIIGLTLFLLGIDLGLSRIGRELGIFIAKSNKLVILSLGGLLLGFFVSVAEPDLHILANQVSLVTSGMLSRPMIVLVVSTGVALLVMLGLLRIVYNIKIKRFLILAYLMILVFGALSAPEFLAIAFDASGATTGALTVPFILAIAYGVSGLKKDSKSSEEDSFGLLGIASAGAILSVLVMGVISGVDEVSGELHVATTVTGTVFGPFLADFWKVALESVVALAPIVLIFYITNFFVLKLSRRLIRRITSGVVLTLIGLTIFMLGVHAGFMEVGTIVGYKLASFDATLVLTISFLIGIVTVLAEPAVYVLTHQVEDVTSGYVSRSSVVVALGLAIGLAIMLSVLRIMVPWLHLWHFLLPGYLIAMVLTIISPPLFVGVAFDAGGVASGPMTATFILSFAHGVATAIEHASVMADGFGIIAMVAMMPLIALQLLGLLFKIRARKDKINE